MKQEFWVALEGERTIYVMNTTLHKVSQHDTLCDEKKSMPLLLAPTNCKDVRIRTEASRLTGNIPSYYFLHCKYKAPRLCCRLASRELFCRRWHDRWQGCKIDGISLEFHCCRSCWWWEWVNGRLSIIIEFGSVGWVWNRHRLHPSYAISLVPFILFSVCCLVESWIFEIGLCSQRSFWYVPSKPTELSTKWSRTLYVFLWPDEPISMICSQERHLWFLRKLNKVDFSSLLPTATAATPNIPRLSFW